MSKTVSWVVTIEIHPGQEAAFRKLSEQLIAATRNEAGTLNYEWSLSEDGSTCHIYERYVDSAAVLIHMEGSRDLVGQLFTVADRRSFVIYGAPDDSVKKAMAGVNPVYMKTLGGFSR